MALQLNISIDEIAQKTAQLHEFNPMLGFRGCRLAIIFPEILHMQVRGDYRSSLECCRKGYRGSSGDHDSACRTLQGIRIHQEACDGDDREGLRGTG